MFEIKRTHVPLRREEIRMLAEHLRVKFFGRTIDEVADREKIILHRSAGPSSRGGFCHAELVEDDDRILRPLLAIIINTEYRSAKGERVPELEVFWHEYYHLFYSPSGNDLMLAEAQYSTHLALHAQEERRAQEFAAHMLIDRIEASDTLHDIAVRFGTSQVLAAIALTSGVYQASEKPFKLDAKPR